MLIKILYGCYARTYVTFFSNEETSQFVFTEPTANLRIEVKKLDGTVIEFTDQLGDVVTYTWDNTLWVNGGLLQNASTEHPSTDDMSLSQHTDKHGHTEGVAIGDP